MSIFSYKQRNNITLLIIIALGCLIAYSLQGIFGSILSTLVLYTILRPGYIYLVEVRSWNKNFSAILLLFISIVVLILPFYGLSSMVLEKVAELQNNPAYLKTMLEKVKHLVPVNGDMQNLVEDGLKKVGTWASILY
jgi:predicted PurR-regulated permease PerM